MIGGLAAGRVNVFLDDVPADGPWTFRAATDVRVVPGATAEAKIELVTGVIVTGSVASTDGKPLAGVGIAAYGAGTPARARRQSRPTPTPRARIASGWPREISSSRSMAESPATRPPATASRAGAWSFPVAARPLPCRHS